MPDLPPLPPPLAFEEEPPREVVAPSRPSKEDLAALDALLNPTAPQRSASLPAHRPRAERWEPQFRTNPSASQSRPNRKRRSPMLPVPAGLAVLLVAGGVAYAILRQPPKGGAQAAKTPPTTPRTVPPAPPTTTVAGGDPTPAGEASPAAAGPTGETTPSTAPPATAPPATAPPATAPPPTAPKPTTAPKHSAPRGGGGLADARRLLQDRNFAGAAKSFASGIRATADARYSIQLLVACSDETVDKALTNANAPELLILPVSYKGRSCYRLCWGLYDSESRAEAAVATVPAYFREGGAKPKAAATATLLP
jgi:hypothetical protein